MSIAIITNIISRGPSQTISHPCGNVIEVWNSVHKIARTPGDASPTVIADLNRYCFGDGHKNKVNNVSAV